MPNCLVIVDVQEGFVKSMNTRDLPARILDLVKMRSFDHIVCTRFESPVATPLMSLLGWLSHMSDEEQEVLQEIEHISERTFVKYQYSCFTPDFIRYIYMKHIDKLFLCGVDTDSCILKSAYDAFEFKIPFEVLTSYCASNGGKTLHESAIQIIERNLTNVN